MWIDLSDDETTALLRERDPHRRIRSLPVQPAHPTLPAIRAKLSPEPAREPLPRPKHDEPPRSKAAGGGEVGQ
jgi:hypothetical protein